MSARTAPESEPGETASHNHSRWLLRLTGLLALVWFLVRVVPKPSRAAYPCQRAAMPLASGFVVWLLGTFATVLAYRRWQVNLKRSRLAVALACLAVAVAGGVISFMAAPVPLALADPPTPNDPMGDAKGINPGRVAWVHAPEATDWNGVGDGHWWEPQHTDQEVVDQMMSAALQALTGEASDASAWDALFRNFNLGHGSGDVGYSQGQRIAVKVNLVAHIDVDGWGNVDPATYDMTGRFDYMNTSPQMMLALLRQLVHEAGVDPADIAIGDPVCLFSNQYHDPLAAEFPTVAYLDSRGLFGRTAVTPSNVEFHWSSHPSGVTQDRVLTTFAEADYFINLANLKSHSIAGVTLCGKNYYGWLRLPTAGGFYDLHNDLPSAAPATAGYRTLVDLMGHAHSGGKALLHLIDGLYSGVHPDDSAPIRWDAPPFNGDWTSSLLASQDPVAIDSVGFDILQEEGDPRAYPQMAAADDYLVEAALADSPPSGTFYDPNNTGDVSRLTSLGVHEHWNNPIDRRYSRNLDPVNGHGIELVYIELGLLFSNGFESGDTADWSATVGGD